MVTLFSQATKNMQTLIGWSEFHGDLFLFLETHSVYKTSPLSPPTSQPAQCQIQLNLILISSFFPF